MSGSGNQKIRVMLVDDSAVVRGFITQALAQEPGIEIVASVLNGRIALSTLERMQVDVILLDVEMPEMDGLTALPLMLAASPQTRIIMVSGVTEKSADITLRALSLGAADCITKPSSGTEKLAKEVFFREIIQKVKALGRKTASQAAPGAGESNAQLQAPEAIKCVAIGCSTGGPQALMSLFRHFQQKAIRVPVFITQHMPATFTTILANHLQSASGLPCSEAKNGQQVEPGHVYVAPGDYHLIPRFENKAVRNYLSQDPAVNYCRPAVDPMFVALAGIYGRGLLAIVLTGMGQDGLQGARAVVAKGGQVIVQNEATSVVWGMPGAVAKAGLTKVILPLEDMATMLTEALS